MALDYTQIQALTKKHFLTDIADAIFNSTPTLKYMQGNGMIKIRGGDRIQFPIEYARNAAGGAYARAEILSTADTEVFTSGVLDWKTHYQNVTIFGIDRLKNSGNAAIVDFVKAKVDNAKSTMAYNLTNGIYSDGTTDTDDINGLKQVAAIDRSYAGMDSTTYAWWDGNQDTVDHTDGDLMSTAGLERIDMVIRWMYDLCSFNQSTPDAALTTSTVLGLYAYRGTYLQRMVDIKTLDLGLGNHLAFNGKPIIADRLCTTDYLYWVTNKYLSLVTHPDRNMSVEDWVTPTNQDAKMCKIYWAGNLICTNPRTIGKCTSMGT